jgi:hypothetical protein
LDNDGDLVSVKKRKVNDQADESQLEVGVFMFPYNCHHFTLFSRGCTGQSLSSEKVIQNLNKAVT